MRGLKYVILGVAIAAGVGAVALVQSELDRTRRLAEEAGKPYEVEVVKPTAKTEVLVATRSLKRGQRLNPDALEWKPWPSDLVAETFITRESDANLLEEALGYRAQANLVAGEPLSHAKLMKINHPGVMSAMLRPKMRAFAIKLDREKGVGGFVLPGDYVDVILTRKEDVPTGKSDDHGDPVMESILVTDTLIRWVKVLAVDVTLDSGEEAATEMKRTVTLEVSDRMAELLAISEQAGRMTLALRALTDLAKDDEDGAIADPEPELAVDLAIFAGLSLPEGRKVLSELLEEGGKPIAATQFRKRSSSEGVLYVRGASKSRGAF